MKKIIFILLVLIVGCKTTKTTTESKTETKTDLIIKKDSVKTELEKKSTFVVDSNTTEVYIIDEYFAEPDTTGFQPLVRKIITEINSKGKKSILVNDLKKDSINFKSEIKDNSKSKVNLKQTIKEEIKTPGFAAVAIILIVLSVIIFCFLVLKKFWL